jgi:hypothetical protein
MTDALGGLEGRRAGFELRDTLLILSAGPRSRHVFLFRIPAQGAVIDQVAATGVGGLNIKASRVSYASEADKTPVVGKGKAGLNPGCGADLPYRKENWGAWEVNNSGRWPPNILFVHGEECRQVGEARIEGHKGYPNGPGGSSAQFSQKGTATNRTGAWQGHADAEGKETVPLWKCQDDCPVKILDLQTGDRPSTLTGRADPTKVHGNPGDNHGSSLFGGGNSNVYADSGGASRFFPQFKDDEELFGWMRRLLEAPV